MRSAHIGVPVLVVLVGWMTGLGSVAPAAAQTSDFQWSGSLAPGMTVEIRGVNGSVRAVASNDGFVHVHGTRDVRRGDPDSVRIDLVEHERGVIVCAVYAARADSRENTCRGGDGSRTFRDSDVRVDFVVQVPDGVHLASHTVNGEIIVQGLRSDVQAATVNGRVRVQTTGFVSRVSTVNGDVELEVPVGLNAELRASTVNGTIHSDFPLQVTGRLDRRSIRGTIGSGGPELRVSTVNGSIRLRQM